MSSDSAAAPSVALPKKNSLNKKPVWPITDASDQVGIPPSAKCGSRDGTCCKDLIQEEGWVNPDIVRDVIIGCSDGLTVPFALTAGLSSLGDSRLVVIGGLAELCAGAISMGVGGFLGSQAERDYYRQQRKATSQRVLHSCEEEMEREVSKILGPVGVDDKTCNQLAKCLRDIEVEYSPANRSSSARDEEHASLKWGNEVGLSAFLLKFGEGMEEIPSKRMYVSALTIGLGYLLGGFIPLIPYFFISPAGLALIYSCVLTGIILLIFGAVKAKITGAGNSVWSIIWGAVSTLLVGGIAAGAAFGIVRALEA